MTNRLLVTVMVLAALATAGRTTYAEDEARSMEGSNVRSDNPAIDALIAMATKGSSTFRAMVDTINASDGIVYVQKARCGHGVQACLRNVTSAGGQRFVWIGLNLGRSDRELMASIGHELRHAIEVLSEPKVRDFVTMDMMYRRIGTNGANNAFETAAATKAGEAVRSEIGRHYRRANIAR